MRRVRRRIRNSKSLTLQDSSPEHSSHSGHSYYTISLVSCKHTIKWFTKTLRSFRLTRSIVEFCTTFGTCGLNTVWLFIDSSRHVLGGGHKEKCRVQTCLKEGTRSLYIWEFPCAFAVERQEADSHIATAQTSDRDFEPRPMVEIDILISLSNPIGIRGWTLPQRHGPTLVYVLLYNPRHGRASTD